MRHDSTVRDLMNALEEKSGVPREQQKLIFDHKRLQDNASLDMYHLKHEDVVFMMLNL